MTRRRPINKWFACPDRDYPTVPAPQCMQWQTQWPIPAPEVVRAHMREGLRGMWIDHVPDGAEIAAMKQLYLGRTEATATNPLVTGQWDKYGRDGKYGYVWLDAHPEHMSPQMVMPDAWFDHDEARKPPPAIQGRWRSPRPEWYAPRSGQSVGTVIAHGLCGSSEKHNAEELPKLWRRGLLNAQERSLSAHLLEDASNVLWYQIILDEGWTMRTAAEVLREAGVCVGTLCALTNRWAKPPPGAPAPRSAPAEDAPSVIARCRGQLTDTGAWPLKDTEAIAEAREWKRVR